MQNNQKETAAGTQRETHNKNKLPRTIPPLISSGQVPIIQRDSLVLVTGDKAKTRKSLLIESKAVDVLQEALKEFYSYDSLALS